MTTQPEVQQIADELVNLLELGLLTESDAKALRDELRRLAPMEEENRRLHAQLSEYKALREQMRAAPPQRQTLTDDEIAELMMKTWGCASIAPHSAPAFARAIEAKLKENT